MTLQSWMEQVVERALARITTKCRRNQERQGYVPRWSASAILSDAPNDGPAHRHTRSAGLRSASVRAASGVVMAM